MFSIGILILVLVPVLFNLLINVLFGRRLCDAARRISFCVPSIAITIIIPFKDELIRVSEGQDAGLSAIVIDLKTVAVTRCQQIRFDREHFLPCINAIFQLFPWFIVCG